MIVQLAYGWRVRETKVLHGHLTHPRSYEPRRQNPHEDGGRADIKFGTCEILEEDSGNKASVSPGPPGCRKTLAITISWSDPFVGHCLIVCTWTLVFVFTATASPKISRGRTVEATFPWMPRWSTTLQATSICVFVGPCGWLPFTSRHQLALKSRAHGPSVQKPQET